MNLKDLNKHIKINRDKLRQAKTKAYPAHPNAAVLSELVKYYGGNTECADMLTEILDQEIRTLDVNNWKSRSGVPINLVLRIAAAFDVSPYVLNYKGTLDLIGEAPSWSSLIKEIDIFDEVVQNDLIKIGKKAGYA